MMSYNGLLRLSKAVWNGFQRIQFLSLPSSSQSLVMTSRGVKYRSLPSDDPFGERSSWEDPGDGIFAGWKDIPQEQFAAAADSDKVRHAHFGPEWARFSTVGKMSIQHATQNPNAPVASAEEVNSKNVAAKREMLEKNNFATYEEYLESHLGGVDNTEIRSSPGEAEGGSSESSTYSPFQQGEDEGDAQFDPPPRLPNFITNPETIVTPLPSSSGNAATESTFMNSSAMGASRISLNEIPKSFLQSVYARFPPSVCHDSIPLGDPLTWDTQGIIRFLTHLVPRDADGSSVMDETMISTFEMAAVSGSMLLNTVTPPRLFSLMRRWHVARQRIAIQVWTEYRKPLASLEEDNNKGSTASLPSFDKIETIIKDGIPQMENILSGLSNELVQETILLCFPYGYGKAA